MNDTGNVNKKLLILIYILLLTISYFFYSKIWMSQVSIYINLLKIILLMVIEGLSIYFIIKFSNNFIRIIFRFLMFFYGIMILVSFSNNIFYDKIYNTDKYFFYKRIAFPSPGEELVMYKKNEYLPILERYYLKRTFNLVDGVKIYKKNDTIFIYRTFVDETKHYYLDIKEHIIKEIKQ